MFKGYRKQNKYGAKKTQFMGYTFDSRWEAERWGQLTAMERAGVIRDLERQIKYDIIVNVQGDEPFISSSNIQLAIDNYIKHELPLGGPSSIR